MRARGLTSALWASIDARSIDGRERDDALAAWVSRGRAATTTGGSDDDGTATATATTTTRSARREATDDLELYAARCALEATRAMETRAVMCAAMNQWKLAMGRRVRNEALATTARRRRRKRELKRCFARWCVQMPMRASNDGWNRFGARSTYIAGLIETEDGDFDDEEFPTDYRAELEIRLSQIARLEDALKDANARAAVATREENVEAHMSKFRAHLQNVQRELENVKRERDAYKMKWNASSGPAEAKTREARRANQRTMATQTTFDDDEKKKDAEVAPSKKEIRAAEEKWMEQARLFEQKFQRQMEISNEFDRKLRDERTRLMRSEARYEARIEELTSKQAELIAELSVRGVGTATTSEQAVDFSRNQFAEYAKIGAQAATTRAFPDASPIAMLRSPSPPTETFESPSANFDDAETKSDVEVEKISPAKFESAKKLNFAAALDDFSSSDDEDANRRPMPPPQISTANHMQVPPPPLARTSSARKPLRLTVAVAKIVMLGYSQRDAIEALKHVDGNDVHDALAWLERRARATA